MNDASNRTSFVTAGKSTLLLGRPDLQNVLRRPPVTTSTGKLLSEVSAQVYTASSAQPDAATNFFDVKQPGRQWVLRRYAIGLTGGQYDVKIEPVAGDATRSSWQLSVGLVADGAPGSLVPDAYFTEPPTVAFNWPSNYLTALPLQFDSFTPRGAGWLAVLTIAGPRAADTLGQLVAAILNDNDASRPRASLTITRTLDVAVQQAAAPSLVAATAAPPPARYAEQRCRLDYVIPFWFNRESSGYIVAGLNAQAIDPGPQTGLERVSAPGDSDHFYFRDRANKGRFYYLPKAFKIVRDPRPPHIPMMRIRVVGDGGDLKGTIEYTALPVLDDANRAAAQAHFQGQTPAGQQFSFTPLPMLKDRPIYGVNLPGKDQSKGPFTERPGVSVSLVSGFYDVYTAPMAEFQQLFDALFDPAANFFQGKVTVNADDQGLIDIPFTARVTDFVGELFEQTRSIDPDTGDLKVVLTNAIEGSIHVEDLPVVVLRGDDEIPCMVATDPLLPADLAPAAGGQPAATLTISIKPQDGVADQDLSVTCDLSQTRVVAEGKALLSAILDKSVPQDLWRAVTIKVPLGLFGAKTLSPDKQVTAIQIVFENAHDVTLYPPDAPQPGQRFVTATVQLTTPTTDFLLHRAAGNVKYRYSVNAIYADGSTSVQLKGQTWRTDSLDTLFVTAV